MDNTLISQEIIDELARAHGAAPAVARITEQAMAGEIDFNASLVERVAALRGLTVEDMRSVAKRISLNEGAERVLRAVKHLGLKVALISGGFSFFTEYLRTKLGLDYAFGNVIEMRDGVATGRLSQPVIDGEAKARILREIAAREKIHPEQVVAIGDGANDVAMLSQAGLGIAYRGPARASKRTRTPPCPAACSVSSTCWGARSTILAEIESQSEKPTRRQPAPWRRAVLKVAGAQSP